MLARRYAIAVGLVHALVVTCSLIPGWRAIPLLDADAPTYLKPAENLVAHFAFSHDDVAPFLWEAYRTPSYPLLIAASLVLFGHYQWVLYIAALTAGLAAWCGIRLVQRWGGSSRAALFTAVGFAVLPDSLGYSAQMLTDAIYGHLVIVWIYLVWTGLPTPSMARLSWSAALGMFIEALKPVFNVAAALLLMMGVLLARRKKQWSAVVLLAVLTIPAPLFMALRNLQDHSVFTPTLLGIATTRDYLMARYLAQQSGETFVTMRAAVRREDIEKARQRPATQSFEGRLFRVKQEAVSRFVSEHPVQVLSLMLSAIGVQMMAPEDRIFEVFRQHVSSWVVVAGQLITVVLFAAAGAGGYRLWRLGDARPGLLTMGVLLFCLTTGSVGSLSGTRHRFAADLLAIPLAAIGLARGPDRRQ